MAASTRKASIADDAHLAQLGHEAQLSRHFSPLSMLGLAFAILNSWTALSASLSLALPSGGPTSVLWGLITAGVCNLSLAASLAEFCSAYPTAGGQYHWVAVTAWPSWVPILSFITGWINCFGWVALTATGGLLGSQLVVGIISLWHPDTYEAQPWQQFLIYIGYTLVAFVVNAFGNKILPHINQTAFIWSLTGFVVICITVLATASPNYASGDFVFRDFINTVGWPDGIAWLLGLLQGGLGLIGYDSVAHMIEEVPNAAVEAPKLMIYAVAIGTFTGFVMLMILLFVSGGPAALQEINESAAGPLGQILFIATNSKAGAVCLQIFPLVCLLFAATAIMTTSSRMIFAFARDDGIPFSKWFARLHKTLGVPLNALLLTTACVIIFGCIFLGSSAALNAIVSASVVALSLSYGIPIAVNCLQLRRKLPPTRPFVLPEPLAWVLNLIGLAYVIVTSVLFVFPAKLPVTGSNMNYCIVAFGVVVLISTLHWIFEARKNYTGPRMELEENMLIAETSHPNMMGPDVPGIDGVLSQEKAKEDAGKERSYS